MTADGEALAGASEAGSRPPPAAAAAQSKTHSVTGMATAITLPLLAARHIPAGVSGTQLAAIIAGGGIATALSAALGVGAGAATRTTGFPATAQLLGPGVAVLILAAYAAAVLLAGAALLRHRDITA